MVRIKVFKHVINWRLIHGSTLFFIIVILVISGCQTYRYGKYSRPTRNPDQLPKDAIPKNEPLSKYGNPISYKVDDREYFILHDRKNYKENGIASWYGPNFHGKRTSSGEKYDMHKMTAAHKTLPLPTYVQVTNLQNQKKVIVRINDRGPFVKDRLIDLSYSAALLLGVVNNGTAPVEVKVVTANTSNYDSQNSNHTVNLFIQVGAFSDKNNAKKLEYRLLNSGYTKAHIVTEIDNGSTSIFRVRIGPFAKVADVNTISAKLDSIGISKTRIIIEHPK